MFFDGLFRIFADDQIDDAERLAFELDDFETRFGGEPRGPAVKMIIDESDRQQIERIEEKPGRIIWADVFEQHDAPARPDDSDQFGKGFFRLRNRTKNQSRESRI